jgi:hypothetical protein
MKHLNKVAQTFNKGQENSDKLNHLTKIRDLNELTYLRLYNIHPQYSNLTRGKWFL